MMKEKQEKPYHQVVCHKNSAAFGLLAERDYTNWIFFNGCFTRVRITCHFAVRKTDLRF